MNARACAAAVAIGIGWRSSHHPENSGEIRAVANLQQNWSRICHGKSQQE
jgi:hypothetical protein